MTDATTFERASNFVHDGADGSTWEALEPFYRDLESRPIADADDLERLILDRSEADALADDAGSRLYVAMTCQTDDEHANAAFLRFIDEVQPKLLEIGDSLDRRIVDSPFCEVLDPARYGVMLRRMRTDISLFREPNIAIETELTKLGQRYAQTCGAMTVEFEGRQRTLEEMARYQEVTDRTVRESAWRLVADRRMEDRGSLESIYESMVPLRHQIATNADQPDFRAYTFLQKHRFDYTPDDCHAFAKGVRDVVMPALRRMATERASALGLDTLRPWDSRVDAHGRPPLRPFRGADALVQGTSRVFDRIDPSLGELFTTLRDGHSLDLDARAGKAPGGYQVTFERERRPFIFMNAAGLQRDVETMLHEGGHAFHSLLARDEPLLAYRLGTPTEFAEVASMSMELLAHRFLDEFYDAEEGARARRTHLEGVGETLAMVALIDQFQHWVYTHPGHTRDERTETWVSLMNTYGDRTDWSGLEPQFASSWHRVLHLFEVPFYFIEYGIAQLGALQLWMHYRRDPSGAIEAYKRALSLGGSRGLSDLYDAAGLEFDFGPEMIERLWGEVERDLRELPA